MSAISIAASSAMAIEQAQAQYSAQKNQADAQAANNATQAQYIQQDKNSETTQAQTQEGSVNLEAYQKDQQNAQAAQAATATAQTAAGEAGVGGNSVAALQSSYMARSGQFQDQVAQNRDASNDRLQLQMQGFDTSADAATARLPVPNYPSDAGLGLSIGGAVLNAGMKGVALYNGLPSATPDTSPVASVGPGY